MLPPYKSFPVHLAIIQPTTFCNLDCTYCYLPDRAAIRKMTPAIAEQMMRFLFRNPELVAKQMTMLWHSGEPLVQPISFYETAFQMEQHYAPASTVIRNSIQTNGTLINQQWCDFIRAWDIDIGVSLDGPRWLHDANRVDRSGKATFDRVLRGIEFLQSNDIKFSVIAVLSEKSLDCPAEIWHFFRDLGVQSLHFLCEEVQGVHLTTSVRKQDRLTRVRSFYERLLELRAQTDPSISIRDLDYFFNGIPVWHGSVRAIEQLPLGIVNISWDGKVTTFSPELLAAKTTRYGEFVFAHVAQDSLEDILENPTFLAVYKDILAGVHKCRMSCEYFDVCGGGQPSNKYYENGSFDSTETLTCQTKIIAACSVVLQSLERQHGFGHEEGLSANDRIKRLQPLMDAPPLEKLRVFEFVS